MTEFKTPGVYVNEVQKFPPSVAQVETAVPSFIGYTEQAVDGVNSLKLLPKKITSMVEFETHFGGANKESIELQDTKEKGLTLLKPKVKFLMYYSLQMYFANGGGPCYIISVGDYTNGVEKAKLKDGLDASDDVQESTLVIFPDATSLTDEEQFYAIYQDALSQAAQLKNRFVILDTYLSESNTENELNSLNTVEYLREKIGSNIHAAAYFPHLKTVMNYAFDEKTTIIHKGLQTGGNLFFNDAITELNQLQAQVTGANQELLQDLLAEVIATIEEVNETADVKISLINAVLLQGDFDERTVAESELTTVINALKNNLQTAEDKKGDAEGKKLEDLKVSNSILYNQIKKEIEALKVILPPSSTMAGIYAKVDSTKGVWKAPANVGVNYVISTTEKISDEEQKELNVHATGKSINAIRTFTGKGTLVWGARTFDSSGDWRYISVRRLFDMVEESVKNATLKFLYDPNDANTWVKVKAMIENYLNQLWMNGALAGSTPEQAYYVNIGLDKTMSSQEILAGIMNVQIGMAAVRPAEFIVLNFSHKLQES